MKLIFKLSMPGYNSWGNGKNYIIKKDVSARFIKNHPYLEDGNSWSYSFSDGWRALITIRYAEKGERIKSDGFAGYSWMVDSIMRNGEIKYE